MVTIYFFAFLFKLKAHIFHVKKEAVPICTKQSAQWVHRQFFAKINTKHYYNTRLSAKECFSVKFSRTEKMKTSFTRIGVSIWNSIPLSVKTLNISNFRKKIKSLLLNVLGNEDNYLNVNYLTEYFVKLA